MDKSEVNEKNNFSVIRIKKTLFFLYTKGDLDNPDFGGRASLLLPPHRTVGHLKAREGGGKRKEKKGS